MCRLLSVSTSGFSRYKREKFNQVEDSKNKSMTTSSTDEKINPTKQSNELKEHSKIILEEKILHKLINQIFVKSRREYGHRKIQEALKNMNYFVGKNRIRKCMKRLGLRALYKAPFRNTTDSNHENPVAPNLLNRNFYSDQPNKVWTTDITYIHTHEGDLYLCIMLDLFSRQIVGWNIQDYMQAELVVDALEMAYLIRQPEAGLIVHSDRGSQYTSQEFQKMITDKGLRSSMSKKGDCWDNAPTESLWGHLKLSVTRKRKFNSKSQAKKEIISWIGFYNSERLHETLGYKTPMQFEQDWLANLVQATA